jgi:translation initiation factor 3 subunit H
MKHGREAPSSTAHGLLLGLDLDGTLEVSNSFPLPHHAGDEDEKSTKSIGESEFTSIHSRELTIGQSTIPGIHVTITKRSTSG